MFEGSIVALVTPMDRAGAIDYERLGRLVEFHHAAGTAGLVIGGTTGESATLEPPELVGLVRAVRELAPAQMPVIAGTGSGSTARAIELTRSASRAGADACLVVTPAYNKPVQEGLRLHFLAVADAASVPVIVYNVPSRTACDLAPETVARLAEHERIVAVKEAVPGAVRTERIRELCGDSVTVLSGDDASARASIAAGARGVITVTGNCAPAATAAMCAHALAGRREMADAIDMTLAALHSALFCQSSPIPVKWALARMGLIDNNLRLPMTPLADEYHELVEQALREAGVELPG